jgi:hypothetical protein
MECIFELFMFFRLAHLSRCHALRWISVERTGLSEAGLDSFLRGRAGMAFKAGVIYLQ